MSILYQACTGIEDVEVAIGQLEDAGWVLVVSSAPLTERSVTFHLPLCLGRREQSTANKSKHC